MSALKKRILYIVSHPIQYQAPLLRLISTSDDIDINTVFYWDKKNYANYDVGFNLDIQWDVPVLSGYRYQYLSDLIKNNSVFQKLVALWKIINPNNYDVVWVHGYTELYTVVAIIFTKIKGIIVFARGESMFFSNGKKSLIKKITRKFFFLVLNKLVDRFLAIGTNNKNFYLENNIPEDKIFLCNYTVDNGFFRKKHLQSKKRILELKSKLNLDPERPIILYASKFITRKYPIDLLNAYLMLCKNIKTKKPYLLFVGAGETYNAVRAVATQSGEKSIRFFGFKNQSELPDYFSLTDIFVLPSKKENWGLVVNEAMNAECAIIVSDQVGCAPDLVQHNINGFIYPTRNVTMLLKYLQILIENPVLCEKMKRKSNEIISKWDLSESLSGLRAACFSVGVCHAQA